MGQAALRIPHPASRTPARVLRPASLPSDVKITHVNLYDGTVEGLRHETKPVFCVQYHPEAAPGPHDADYLFRQFLDEMEKRSGE